LGRQTIDNIVEIGRRLTEAKKIVGHGGWLPWLDREFGWEETTALRFMRVHKLTLSKSGNLPDLPVSGLYLLAAPSTPESAKAEIIERAEAGEALLVAEVKRVVEKHKDHAGGRKQRGWSRERHKRRRARKRGVDPDNVYDREERRLREAQEDQVFATVIECLGLDAEKITILHAAVYHLGPYALDQALKRRVKDALSEEERRPHYDRLSYYYGKFDEWYANRDKPLPSEGNADEPEEAR